MSRLLLYVAPFVWMLSIVVIAAPRATSSSGFVDHVDDLFRTSSTCVACHNQLTTPTGEDVSIGSEWRGSIMANSSRDPYWQASVRREVIDRPALRAAIEDECSTCHMPMARAHAKARGRTGAIFDHLPIRPIGSNERTRDWESQLAADGVSCTLCHQITREKLGTPESFTGGFVIDLARPAGERPIFGPFAIDRGRTTIMRSAAGFVPTESPHVQSSELCATCHTLYTHARGPADEVIARLPEQVPYDEWLHSAYRTERTCQSCHMPSVAVATPITGVLGEPRDGLSRHVFRGGNFFMLEMLNRYRAELGVVALPQELSASARGTRTHLQEETARVRIEHGAMPMADGRLSIDVIVENLTGHKLPTGYPARRAWLHLAVRDVDGRLVFESGAIAKDGHIEGNDNDADGVAFERHHTEIRDARDVQIYESIMADARDRPTTGLLSGVRFVKDNRLLPRGFDKRTAKPDIAVHGEAMEDADFGAGGDRVRYVIDISNARGPFAIEAALWYQPIAFRWAHNLEAYDAAEPRRFVEWYRSMADASGIVLAKQSITLP